MSALIRKWDYNSEFRKHVKILCDLNNGHWERDDSDSDSDSDTDAVSDNDFDSEWMFVNPTFSLENENTFVDTTNCIIS